MARRWDLLAIGDVCVDLIVRGVSAVPLPGQERLVEGAQLALGGATSILAAAAARLGLRVAIVGMVGADPFGQFARQELAAAGVDTSALVVEPQVGTGVTISLSTAGERALVTYPGTIPHLAARHVPSALLERARHVHVSSYFLQTALQPDCPALLRRALALGATTSLDTGDDPADRWDAGLAETLTAVDCFFPNEREATRITGETSAERALERLAERVPTVAVKLGAAGAIACVRGERLRVDAYRVPTLDTTGAGDVFDAGYLWGLLSGQPIEVCLRRAAAAGALATTWPGGQSGALSSEAVERLIKEGMWTAQA